MRVNQLDVSLVHSSIECGLQPRSNHPVQKGQAQCLGERGRFL